MNDHRSSEATTASTEPGLQPGSNGKHFFVRTGGREERRTQRTEEDAEDGESAEGG